ncbi:MAG: hypothetical protein AW08_03035 [Candidatus Accumulibacter adjunctus]|uniref:Uncharacterized protein n=1 Tax=Candidatus Accumulibacter adjunctus TaxID=1454001 RepID=A0A011PHC1_9PROT|nr:MAG: hypothetical protein AW08_03035 [Candidatus Accumulibacter adjunctus]
MRQRPGEKEQHQQDENTGGELRDLAAATAAIDHGGVGRAAIDDEGPRQAGAEIGHAEADHVHVLVEAIAVLGGIGARGGGALRQDDDEAGEGDRQQLLQQRPAPFDLRQAERRQTARHRAERLQVGIESQRPADADGTNDGDQPAGHAIRDSPATEDHHHNGERDAHRVSIAVANQPQVAGDLEQRVVARSLQAEHARYLEQRHLHTDAGEEADENGTREEIGEETEAQDACGEHQHAGDQRQQAAQRQPLVRAAHRHAGEAGGDDRRRRRIGTHRQMSRRPENGEQRHRDEDGVEPGDHRRTDDLGVTHGARDGERGQGQSGQDIARQAGAIDRQNPLQNGQPKAPSFALLCHRPLAIHVGSAPRRRPCPCAASAPRRRRAPAPLPPAGGKETRVPWREYLRPDPPASRIERRRRRGRRRSAQRIIGAAGERRDASARDGGVRNILLTCQPCLEMTWRTANESNHRNQRA